MNPVQEYDFGAHKSYCSDVEKCPLADRCKRVITIEEEEHLRSEGKMLWLISYLRQDGGECRHFLEK